jgi:hypothetical protein
MFDSPNQSRRATACRALVALIGASGCLAAVAYAASAPPSPGVVARLRPAGSARPAVAPVPRTRPAVPRPPRPRITGHPTQTTLSSSAQFRYVDGAAAVEFQCKLDEGSWKRCGSRVGYRGLAVGGHRFLVRAEAAGGRRGRPSRFAWAQAQPADFSIEPDLSSLSLSALYPGAAPVALPVVLTNPNSAPIRITALRVSVTGDPAGCGSAENLELTQSSASSAAPLTIPAGGSVRLPAPGVSAPAIALRDLPVDQDACQGAHFPLAFSGEAHG